VTTAEQIVRFLLENEGDFNGNNDDDYIGPGWALKSEPDAGRYVIRVGEQTFEGNHFVEAVALARAYGAFPGWEKYSKDGFFWPWSSEILRNYDVEIVRQPWPRPGQSGYVINNDFEQSYISVPQKRRLGDES